MGEGPTRNGQDRQWQEQVDEFGAGGRASTQKKRGGKAMEKDFCSGTIPGAEVVEESAHQEQAQDSQTGTIEPGTRQSRQDQDGKPGQCSGLRAGKIKAKTCAQVG